jgi:EmrB/QacA subfamily drug resistance transporter
VVVRQPCDVGVIAGASVAPAPCPRATGMWVLAATVLGSSMVFIDGTVVNVALPVMQADLHATAIDMQWVVNAYMLFLAALMLVGGSLGDLYGRKLVFLIGTVIFTLASLACGLAADVHQLILARGIQGVGSALLTPGSLALISATFAKEQRGAAIGTWSSFTTMTAAAGPVLGGLLVQYLSWRWIFFINVPLAIAVVAVTLAGVPESREDMAVRRLDVAGALLATVGLGALTIGLVNAGTLGWSSRQVIADLLGGILALGAFVAVEARAAQPMMPLELFRSRTFSAVNIATFLLYAAIGGVLYFVPFNLIQIQGYTPTAAGLSILPFAILMIVLSRWSGGMVSRFGPKPFLVIGPAIATFGLALYAVPGVGGSYWTTFFPPILTLGLGMGITVAPLTTTVLGSVPARHVGVASAVNNAVSRSAGLFAVAALSVVMLGVFGARLDQSIASLPASAPVTARVATQMAAQHTKLAAAQVPDDVPASLRDDVRLAVVWSYVAAFRTVMLIGALLALLSVLVIAIMLPGGRHEETDLELRSSTT